jgi:hypothetical protein
LKKNLSLDHINAMNLLYLIRLFLKSVVLIYSKIRCTQYIYIIIKKREHQVRIPKKRQSISEIVPIALDDRF